jgi:hypothetical protein
MSLAAEPRVESSSSAADRYAMCPLNWSLRYGPGRHGADREDATADAVGDLNRRRGNVLHAGMQAACERARAELDALGTPLPGATLYRYWPAARRALGRAWDRERMPSDPSEADYTTDLLVRTLEAVPVPPPGTIDSIERERHLTTPGGVSVVFKIDYAWRPRPGALRIVDWKSGRVTPRDVRRNQQLLRYAGWSMLLDPTITAVEIELFSMRAGRGHVEPADPQRIAKALALFDRLARAAAADPDPQPTPGRHCVTCSHRRACPAVAGTAMAADA